MKKNKCSSNSFHLKERQRMWLMSKKGKPMCAPIWAKGTTAWQVDEKLFNSEEQIPRIFLSLWFFTVYHPLPLKHPTTSVWGQLKGLIRMKANMSESSDIMFWQLSSWCNPKGFCDVALHMPVWSFHRLQPRVTLRLSRAMQGYHIMESRANRRCSEGADGTQHGLTSMFALFTSVKPD